MSLHTIVPLTSAVIWPCSFMTFWAYQPVLTSYSAGSGGAVKAFTTRCVRKPVRVYFVCPFPRSSATSAASSVVPPFLIESVSPLQVPSTAPPSSVAFTLASRPTDSMIRSPFASARTTVHRPVGRSAALLEAAARTRNATAARRETRDMGRSGDERRAEHGGPGQLSPPATRCHL